MSSETRKTSVKPPIINSLTGIRALGAWWIILFHMQDEIAEILPRSPLTHFIDAGHIGVTLFFILSGFILSYNYAPRFCSLSSAKYFNFLGQRLARIYPVHLVTLVALLGLVVTASLTGQALDSPEKYTAVKFFQHIFLVNGWTLPIETSWNGVAWTLSVEWLCYLLFPLLSALLFKIQKPGISIAAIALILTVIPAVAPPDGVYEVIMFVVGLLLGKLYLVRFGAKLNWSPIVAGSLIAVLIVGSVVSVLPIHTSVVASFMVLLIYGLVWDEGWVSRLFGSSAMVYWGYTSYSLFMVHPVVLRVLRKALSFERLSEQGLPILMLALGLYLLVIGLISRWVYLFVEEPGRTWIKNRIKALTKAA